MAKKRLTIGKSDGTTSSIDFNIPETQGTYNIKATLENGTVLNAGNIVVNGKANNYKVTIGLSNGSSVNVGTFATPIIYRTVSFTNPSYGAWGSSSLSLPYGTTYSVSGNTITFTKPDGSKVTNTAKATSPTARTLSFGTASYGSWNSTASVSVYDYSYSTPSINATSGTITANATFSASNSRSNVTFANSLGGTSGTNATYSGNHTWTISGTTTSGSSFSRTFTSTAHNAQYYYVISRNSSATQATSNISFTPSVSRSVHSYTLYYSAKPTGVATHTVYRNGVALSNGATIYYGETLTQTATATTGYNNPSVNWSSITVTGNVTATATAGSVAVQWRTIFSGSTTITTNSESGATKAISGLRANVPTKITFSGNILNNWGFASNAISQRTNAESSNGVYSGSGHQTGYDSSGEFERDYDYGFTLTMQDGSVLFKPYVNGYVYDLCDEQYTIDLSSASVTITNIQQYY